MTSTGRETLPSLMVLTVGQSSWYLNPQSQENLSQITFYGELKMPRQRLACHPWRVTKEMKEIYTKLFWYRFMLHGKVRNFSGQVSMESSYLISMQRFWYLAQNSQPHTLSDLCILKIARRPGFQFSRDIDQR